MTAGDQATISVLLPVHRGVAPAHLRAAVDSVLSQSRSADEVVVVEDGPLDPGHHEVLGELETRHPAVVRIALESNQGAGAANQAGLQRCTGTWVAKVDADDISRPERFERQLAAVTQRGLDLLGSAMLEFEHDPSEAGVVRAMPLDETGIRARMPINNPFNHPTVFYRRTVALGVGGYPDLRFMQDYVLFARMARSGARMANLADPLVAFRAGPDLHRRRADPRYTRLELGLRRELRRTGFAGPIRSWVVLALRLVYRRLPATLVRELHRRLLARPAAAPTTRRPRDVVRWQLTLAWRSLRVLARRPQLGRELPRLLATAGRSTMRLRLPWLPFRLIDELAERVDSRWRVFEYGGGGSTAWFLDRGAEVVTVEHDARWADALARDLGGERWTLLRRPAEDGFGSYVDAVSDYPDGYFDIVVVDGRERARCLLAARSKVRPGGWLVLDDSDRARYAEAADSIAWRRRDVIGFAPAKPTLAYTTVFERPET